MTKKLSIERARDFDEFRRLHSGGALPFLLGERTHVYIKLEFKPEFENASDAEAARRFLRSVARAALAAHHIAEQCDGFLLEVQGSLLHVGLPLDFDKGSSFVAALHGAYRIMFDDKRLPVDGWRMTVDGGNTLIVAGRGVHGDESYVSLGTSANRPAKHLYAQLEIPEDERSLKRFHVAVRNPVTDHWMHSNLDDQTPITISREIADQIGWEVKRSAPILDFSARALPIAPSGTPSSPTPDTPQTYFGWVMRADLDGFTARVDQCFDNNLQLRELANEFYQIMDAAKEFVSAHEETLAQLPWAGDNFTAAAVFATKCEYDEAAAKRIVELSLDFEKEMKEAADDSGFGGWAHSVAGGNVHGSSHGNIYLAGVEVVGRRFLVGAGEGFGRSAQGFGDINPDGGDFVLYEPDYSRLHEDYASEFSAAKTKRDHTSTLYKIAKLNSLLRAMTWMLSANVATAVTIVGGRSHSVSSKPYTK